MLTLEHVSAGYGGADVIRNISLQVKRNENLSIVGPNGCGKTTLLKAIAHLIPYKGTVTLDEVELRHMSRREVSLKIGMLSQQFGMYFTYSVFETVMMGRYLHIKNRFSNRPTDADRAVVMRALEAVHLVAEQDKEVTKLSGGQLQRVFLARTLAQEPELILLDEPTNHLDIKCQMELIAYLKDWAKEGSRAVIGVLHDINLAIQLSENLLVMKDGEMRASGRVDEILADGLLNETYEMDVTRYMQSALQRWVR
ncbi:MAG: ABC transporter ATP-binding protein [Oscillospiraceae bacterium]|nr:ABC transporter ATP-binding protein [Oscillospiraceae bacterium]